MDPKGTEERRKHRLCRRAYRNNGPNDTWNCDGYDKRKPFGFPIHACIDGWSRKVLCLYVMQSNNYWDLLSWRRSTPRWMSSETEYRLGAWESLSNFDTQFCSRRCLKQSLLRSFSQRSEAWWSYFRRRRTNWWINFFKDLEQQGTFNPASELESECLWFCFVQLLQEDVEQLKEHWNTHYIGKWRHDTVSGRPDSLY